MTDFDWSLAGPFLIVCAAVALLIIPSIAKDVRRARDARRAKAAQLEPEPVPDPTRDRTGAAAEFTCSAPTVSCSVYGCHELVCTLVGPDQWPMCGTHAAPYRLRSGQNRSAS